MKGLFAYFAKLTPFRIALALTVLVVAADLKEPLFLKIVELKALDLKFKTRGVVKPDPQVALVTIDEKSVKEIGRWPWPRSVQAQLIDKLREAGAKAVALDIVYSEADQNSELVKMQELVKTFRSMGLDKEIDFGTTLPAEYAQAATAQVKGLIGAKAEFYRKLKEDEAKANNDQYLADAIARFKDSTILGYFFYGQEVEAEQAAHSTSSGGDVSLIEPSKVGLISTIGAEPSSDFIRMDAVVANIPLISAATEHRGHFYMLPDDEDGTIRWNHLVLRFEDGYYPSLGLKAASVALGKPIMLKIENGYVAEIRLGDIQIPTDEYGRLLINFAGRLTDEKGRADVTFKQYSFVDIINDRVPASELAGKIFVVGPTAVGIYDLRNTPFDPMYPGVGVHANVIDNILSGKFLQKPTWMKLFDIFIILGLGLVLGVGLGRLKGAAGALLAGGLGTAYFIFTQYAFVEWGIWLSTVYPLLEIVVVFAAIVTYKYMTEERQAKQIRGAFSNYVTPSVVDQVLKDPSRLKLGGETRELSVMFSDVRGFTTISERLTAEQLVDLLNAYLSKMTDLVFKSDGTLDKYIGDALMAIWGAPVEQPDHAKRACYTAIEMMEVLNRDLKPDWAANGLKHIPAGSIPEVDIGIGINSGIMSVGNMGSDQRFDYTVMGDNVNLASRLEGTNKAYGTHIIISEFTYKLCANDVVVRELDLIRVKGKHEPVRIYELVGKAGQVDAAQMKKIAAFEKGLAHYRKREWDEAEAAFKGLLAEFAGDETSEIFLERIAEHRQEDLPADWDGVYVMKTK